MITNFDYLKKDSKFSRFADVAISAEKIILMDPEASILNSRRAMEFAIKWMYSVDSELEMPYQDNLQSLMNAEEYRQIVGPDLWKRMDYIRRSGNSVAHNNKKLGVDEAMLCLENLFIYLDYIAYCYSTQYEEHSFDKTIITSDKCRGLSRLCRKGNIMQYIFFCSRITEGYMIEYDLSFSFFRNT